MAELPPEFQERIEDGLGRRIHSITLLGGGCIANASRLETDAGPLFMKWSEDDPARTFEAEADGLQALRAAGADLIVPEVYLVEAALDGRTGFLITEFIRTGKTDVRFWERSGRGLAELHRHVGEAYGFHTDNYIGRLPQVNDVRETWPEFFRACRLEPQRQMARERGRWPSEWNPQFDRLLDRLDEWLPRRPDASVLHGDLWSGNFLAAAEGTGALIDPASYYGHRETDLAMARLFGGFSERFFAAYDEAWPEESGAAERQQIYQLYHLINHLNHFGGSYARDVAQILRRL